MNLFDPPRLVYHGTFHEVMGGRASANSPLLFEDENGLRFLAKALHDDHPNLVVNEWIGQGVAAALGLRVPPAALTVIRGRRMFATAYVEGRSLATYGLHNLRERLADWQDLLLMLCADLITMNNDRHHGNVFVVREGNLDLVVAIDHDRCLYQHMGADDAMEFKHGTTCANVVHVEQANLIRQIGPTVEDFSGCFKACAALTDTQIEEIIDPVSADLGAGHCQRVADILRERRDNIAACIAQVMQANAVHSYVTPS